jgi:hypothetical protein
MAVTKPVPPEQSALSAEASGRQLQPLKSMTSSKFVMPGLVPGIHVLL